MFAIGDRPVGPGHRPYIIAEAGVNFQGNVQIAKSFIDAAAEAGADAIKIQTHIPEKEMVRSAMTELGFSDLYDRMAEYQLSLKDHRALQNHASDQGITLLSTPFSVEAVALLDQIGVPAIKIGSGEFTNRHLVKNAADTNRPLILSTGMADWDDIEASVPIINQWTGRFALLYCVSAYPTDPMDFNLGVIGKMKDAFDVPVGFSDHSTGIEAAVVAMGRGADIVEKHFTLTRRLPGGDQQVSIEPDELAKLVEYADLYHETTGDEKPVLPPEQNLKEWALESVVATETIEAGEKLTESNTTTKRPGTGISAADYYEVLGRTVNRRLPADSIVQPDDLASKP